NSSCVTPDSESSQKPRVGITLGDPSGIGPEIVLKSVADPRVNDACRPLIIGSAAELHRQAELLRLPHAFQTRDESSVEALQGDPRPAILDTGLSSEAVAWGRLSAASGRHAIAAVETAVRLSLSPGAGTIPGLDSSGLTSARFKLDAVATAPINKEALRLAG